MMNATMMKNKVQLIGNLGQAPEIKNLDNGNKMARISLATSEKRKNAKGESVIETQWHPLVAWGKTAELAEKFLLKGSEIMVEGKLVHRSYNDKDGVKKYISEVEIYNFLMLDKKQGAE